MAEATISKMDDKKLEKLILFVEKLPEPEKNRPVLFIEGKLFNWKTMLDELKKGGDIAEKIKSKIMEKAQ
jgi:hypothetical protein